MTKNRDVFRQDPEKSTLANNGVAAVTDADPEFRTLMYELRTFVCEGEYHKGLSIVLDTYLGNLDKPEQPAVWISGFYGSGKSHLAKVLRYLWTDYALPDKSTARGIANLPAEIKDALKELSTKGRQNGGLHAAAGTLGPGANASVPLAVLAVVFRSCQLPEDYPGARFVLWLKAKGLLDRVRADLKKSGEDFDEEVRNLYVSTPLAKCILKADPAIAATPEAALHLIEKTFPPKNVITIEEMVKALREALLTNGKLPCTAIILDEVQQYIGEDQDRSYAVQEVVEAISKRFDGKLIVIGTGQAALTSTAQLSRLKGRFTRNVHLSDTDVETVIRKVVLQKRADREAEIRSVLDACHGEISKHLVSTKIAPCPEDEALLVTDYPLLPVRQRFWERILRAVDSGGLTGQLRTQLRIAHEAARALAPEPLGHVVPASFIYDQVATDLLQRGVLVRELHNVIAELLGGSADDVLRGRLCALVFLIGKLPTQAGADLGVRATADTLADLLVQDLKAGSADLRKRIPALLADLEKSGRLLRIEDEYKLQTQEGTVWLVDFRERYAKILGDNARMAQERADLLKREVGERLKEIKLLQGTTKVLRKLEPFFGETPQPSGQAIPVWIRNGWDETESNVLAQARAAGVDSPLITVFIPKRAAEDLKKTIAEAKAAKETLDTRGNPTTPEGLDARAAMETRALQAEANARVVIETQVLGGARVILGGGQEIAALDLLTAVREGAEAALVRQFPEFHLADQKGWEEVLKRTKAGAADALEAVGYKGSPEQHPVCSAILAWVGTGKKGSEIRRQFGGNEYGWSQDAIDAALLVLLTAGQIRASQNGKPVDRTRLDHTKIGVTDFRIEVTVITASQRIALRNLYNVIDIKCQANEEASKAESFLTAMLGLADAAGGAPPLALRPNTAHIKDLQNLGGNEQLIAILNEGTRLTKEAGDWRAAGELARQRLPRWVVLNELLSHARGLPVYGEVEREVEAISRQCALLATPDPVPALCERLTTGLRAEIVKLHGECVAMHQRESAGLAALDSWKKLATEQRDAIVRQAAIEPLVALSLGTEEALRASLLARSLESWRSHRDALPARFQTAALLAAKLLEPNAVRVALPAATIRTPEDLDRWLAEVRTLIGVKLTDGPVVI